ncbi:MAG: hypothetical protein ACKO0M_04030, partial [Cyanobium sp.]
MTTSRSSNTSRAFWELRAEQVMDRVFTPAMAVVREPEPRLDTTAAAPLAHEDDSIEVEVREAPAVAAATATRPTAPATPATPPSPAAPRSSSSSVWSRPGWVRSPWRPRRPLLQAAWLSTPWQIAGVPVSPKLALACSGGLACLALGTSASLWLGWNQASADLRQERTIRLIEGIRGLDGGDGAARAAATTAKADKPGEAADGLPPPPPNEPWIEDLGQLDGQGGGGGGGAAPLQVPVNGTLRAPAPVASAAAASPGPATPPPPLPATGSAGGSSPELVGVVQIPGKPGSAIFQVGGSSTNASSGESIGSSGWRLVSTSGDSA